LSIRASLTRDVRIPRHAMAVATWSCVVTGCFHTFGDSADAASPSLDANGHVDDVTMPAVSSEASDGSVPEAAGGSGDRDMQAPSSEADATKPADAATRDSLGQVDQAGPPSQCVGDAGGVLGVRFTDGFESYPLAKLIDAGSPWLEAKFGRDAIISNQWPHSGTKDLMIDSLTVRSEVVYISPLQGPPRRIVVELWFTPDGYYIYEDFLELGLGYAASLYDLRPTVALKLHDHSLFVTQDPGAPATDGGPPGGIELQNTIPYLSSFNGNLVATYLRIDFDLCSNTLDAFAGAAPDAGTHRTATFRGDRPVTSVYLAGGLNPTYVDDIAISADDGK
jgi:hypothetical protein